MTSQKQPEAARDRQKRPVSGCFWLGGSQGALGNTWTWCEPGGSHVPGGRASYLG